MFRIANLLVASFFVLCVIVPDSWCHGPSDPGPLPSSPPSPGALRQIILTVATFIWFASALGLFFRSRLCWYGSLVGVGMMIVLFIEAFLGMVRYCILSDPPAMHDGRHGLARSVVEGSADLMFLGFLGICFAFAVGLFFGLLMMRRDLRWI
jgi:hypothetical protein